MWNPNDSSRLPLGFPVATQLRTVWCDAEPGMEALRAVLDPWLGKPQWKQTEGRVTFVYRFYSEDAPPIPLRLKVEINSREHFSVYGFKQVPFCVSSRWFEGCCQVNSYELDELLGTKLRALYQRKQGRDLFDLATALGNPAVNPSRIVETFSEYMKREGHRVTRALFEINMAGKLHDPEFAADIRAHPGYRPVRSRALPVRSRRRATKLPRDQPPSPVSSARMSSESSSTRDTAASHRIAGSRSRRDLGGPFILSSSDGIECNERTDLTDAE